MGSVGAADIARGVGNGLGVVRTIRVIAVFEVKKYCRSMSHFYPECITHHASNCLAPSSMSHQALG